jgi:hypothetical protein
MEITKASMLTGVVRTKDLEVTEEQILRWQNGELIQNVLPNLSADDREFIITGITPEDWEASFSEEDL